MTVVPSSNVIDPSCWPIMSNNDPDAFIERMNAKAKELGMTNTVWNNPEWGGHLHLAGLLSGQQLSK